MGTDGELLPAAQGAFMEVREDRRGGKKQAMEQAMTEEMERLRRMPVQQLRARYREGRRVFRLPTVGTIRSLMAGHKLTKIRAASAARCSRRFI